MKTSNLRSGAIYESKKGKDVKVLYVTNLDLDQDKHPSQVVFSVDESVLSCSIKSFEKMMAYKRFDTGISNQLMDVLLSNTAPFKVNYSLLLEASGEPSLNADTLQKQFSYYTEVNTEKAKYITLGFTPSKDLFSLEILLNAFNPENDNPHYDSVSISLNNYVVEVNWDTITNVAPAILDGNLIYTITFCMYYDLNTSSDNTPQEEINAEETEEISKEYSEENTEDVAPKADNIPDSQEIKESVVSEKETSEEPSEEKLSEPVITPVEESVKPDLENTEAKVAPFKVEVNDGIVHTIERNLNESNA